MSAESSSSTPPAVKYYRVLRLDDELYKAPGLVQRQEDDWKAGHPLYFTDYAGVLSYALRWGTTYCEVKIPKGITVKKQERGHIYEARLIRLGKVKPINGEFIANILHTLHSSGELTTSIIGELMGSLGLEVRVDLSRPDGYDIMVPDEAWIPYCEAPTEPYTKYQLETYYKPTPQDFRTIVDAIAGVLSVDATITNKKPVDNVGETR